MAKVLTVYKKPNCTRCKMTIRYGKQLGYDVVVEELFDNNGELNTVPKFYHDTYNFSVSPIVTLSEDGVLLDKWDNFRVDLLNRYKE